MNQKDLQSIYRVHANVNLVKENVIQINGGITVNVDVSGKNIIFARKIISGILVHAVVKIATIQQVLWLIQQLLVMKLQTQKLSQTTKKQKHFQQILMKKILLNCKI